MSELRKDPVSKRWVIFSPERAQRPNDFQDTKPPYEDEAKQKYCPFCSGNEKRSGDEILVYPKIRGRIPNTPGWWIRVLENKYPALSSNEQLGKKAVGIYDKMNAVGRHEVIVETEEHKYCTSQLTYEEIEKIIWAYRDRYLEISEDKNIKHILIFKNYGVEAGASIEHTHSQLIATPVVPKRVETALRGAEEYYSFRDRCVTCDILDEELSTGDRVVEENDDFLAFAFFAGRFPYETWIVPKSHNAHFGNISSQEVKSLAEILKNTLLRIKVALGDPNYNYVISTAPINIPGNSETYYHWHIEIMPKLTKIAGFEWGTGFYINPVLPEKAAEVLRSINIEDYI
jgi:UDPglucose--hexose-1-phosphate uridylyltransferase